MKPTAGPPERLFLFQSVYPTPVRRPRSVVGVAALVDLALLLFLFVAHQLPFVLQPGIALTLPEAPFTGGAPYASSIVLTMAQEDLIFVDDERTTLAGLEAALARAVHRNPNAPLLIEADARVAYESLVRVYNLARQQGVQDVVRATRGATP